MWRAPEDRVVICKLRYARKKREENRILTMWAMLTRQSLFLDARERQKSPKPSFSKLKLALGILSGLNNVVNTMI